MNSQLFTLLLRFSFCVAVALGGPAPGDVASTQPESQPPQHLVSPASPKLPVPTSNATSVSTNTVVTSEPVQTKSTISSTTESTTAANSAVPSQSTASSIPNPKVVTLQPTPTTSTTNTSTTTTQKAESVKTSPADQPTTTMRACTYPEAQKDREFDGPSFIGGIILALGLTGIGFVAYKFCKSRTDRNYRNL